MRMRARKILENHPHPFDRDVPFWLYQRFVDFVDFVELRFNEKGGSVVRKDRLNNTAVFVSYMGLAGQVTNKLSDGTSIGIECAKREFGIEWTDNFLNVTIDCPVTGRHVAKAPVKKVDVGDDDKADYLNAAKKAVAYFCGVARAKFFLNRYPWLSEHIDGSSLEARTWTDSPKEQAAPPP